MAMTWGIAQKRKMSLLRDFAMYARHSGACLHARTYLLQGQCPRSTKTSKFGDSMPGNISSNVSGAHAAQRTYAWQVGVCLHARGFLF